MRNSFLTVREVKHLLRVVTQKGYGMCILGDIQNPTRRCPGLPAVGNPSLSRGVVLDDLQRPHPTSAIL